MKGQDLGYNTKSTYLGPLMKASAAVDIFRNTAFNVHSSFFLGAKSPPRIAYSRISVAAAMVFVFLWFSDEQG